MFVEPLTPCSSELQQTLAPVTEILIFVFTYYMCIVYYICRLVLYECIFSTGTLSHGYSPWEMAYGASSTTGCSPGAEAKVEK